MAPLLRPLPYHKRIQGQSFTGPALLSKLHVHLLLILWSAYRQAAAGRAVSTQPAGHPTFSLEESGTTSSAIDEDKQQSQGRYSCRSRVCDVVGGHATSGVVGI